VVEPSKHHRAEFHKALLPEIWQGFERADTAVVVVIVLVWIWSLAVPHYFHDPFHPPGWVVATLAVAFILWQFYKAALRLYAEERQRREQLEQRLTPRLTVGTPHIAANVPAWDGSTRVIASYLRLRILNETDETISRCSANLIKVEFPSKNGWRELDYTDNLTMGWSNKTGDDSKRLNIQPHTSELLDVVYGVEHSRSLYLATVPPAAAYINLMTLAGDYQFTLQISSANTGYRRAQVRIHWSFGNALSEVEDAVTTL
jgi:hypothetical protein